MIRLMPSTVWPRDDGRNTSLCRFCNDPRRSPESPRNRNDVSAQDTCGRSANQATRLASSRSSTTWACSRALVAS